MDDVNLTYNGRTYASERDLKQAIAKMGSRNPNWKGNEIRPRTGNDRARRIFRQVPPCSQCGAKKSERHHIDGNAINNEPSNISFLCRKCHMKADGRLKKLAELSAISRPIAVAKNVERMRGLRQRRNLEL